MRFPSRVVRRWLPVMFVLAVAALCAANGAFGAGRKKRDPTIFIRFHVEVTQSDPTFATKVTAGDPPRELTVEKLPSISERDISSFYPFKATDGTYSAAFQLDEHGRVTLETLSEESRGRYIVAAVNGRPLALIKIDKPINDGIVFIPRGFTEQDIRQMGESFDLMGKNYNPKKDGKRRDGNATPPPLL